MHDFALHDDAVLAPPAGCNCRIGHVDLSAGKTWYEEPSPTWLRRYAGGGALGAWYLLRDIPDLADALGPENVVVFASSIVAGFNAPGLSKHSVLAKSPLTNGAGESQSVSPFGPALKHAGLDAIVIHGASNQPVYLRVSNGVIEVVPATDLWGLETADAHEALQQRESGLAHTAIIGPAGERLVRFASIVNDARYMSCRMGLGAVMGSKRLKAVVAIPSVSLSAALPDMVDDVKEDWAAHRFRSVHNSAQEQFGITSWLAATPGGEQWPYATGNYEDVAFDGLSKIDARVLETRFRDRSAVPPPYIEYARVYRVSDGVYATDPRYGGCELTSLAACGPMLRLDQPEAVLKLIELSYKYGLDPVSTAGTLGWAMACLRDGILSPDDLGGLDARFGDPGSIIAAITAVGTGTGPGSELGEGCARVAAKFGPEARDYAITCKGKELPVHDPRNKPAVALVYGVGPIGPDSAAIEHDWDYSAAAPNYVLKKSHAYGILEGTPETEYSYRKVRQAVTLQRWWSGVLECLLFDLYAVGPARYMTSVHVENLVRGITGWDLSTHEIIQIGERRILLLQEFNRRHGLTRADDFLPARMYDDPVPNGPYAGSRVDRDWYTRAVDLYYEMSGFDNDGRPTTAKLLELDIDPRDVGLSNPFDDIGSTGERDLAEQLSG